MNAASTADVSARKGVPALWIAHCNAGKRLVTRTFCPFSNLRAGEGELRLLISLLESTGPGNARKRSMFKGQGSPVAASYPGAYFTSHLGYAVLTGRNPPWLWISAPIPGIASRYRTGNAAGIEMNVTIAAGSASTAAATIRCRSRSYVG